MRLYAIVGNQSRSVRWCIAMVPMSVICHDYLRWPVVTHRIQSDPSYDGNRVVWGRSYKSDPDAIVKRRTWFKWFVLPVQRVRIASCVLHCIPDNIRPVHRWAIVTPAIAVQVRPPGVVLGSRYHTHRPIILYVKFHMILLYWSIYAKN